MKNIILRAAKTFVQAALAYACTLSLIDIDWSNRQVIGGIVLSALAAGLSALMNIDWTKKEAEDD